MNSRHKPQVRGRKEAEVLEYKGYVGSVEAEDGAFVGRVSGLRDVITFEGVTDPEVEQAFRDSAARISTAA